ncbi:MAG: Fe-S-containing protein [Oscillospiraceae bacterium]
MKNSFPSPCAAPAAQRMRTKETSSALYITVGDMTIALNTLGETPAFADGTIDGQPMQVIAVRDSDGTIRLSYNTCQVCQGSPWAYSSRKTASLSARTAATLFPFPLSAKAVTGCMPLMVPAYTLTDTSVVIPHDTLAQVKDAFENWKVFP